MAKDVLSERNLLKVSNLVTTTFQAEQLAGVLEIDENFVTLEKEQHHLNPRQIALHVLKEWRRVRGKNRATAKALIRAVSTDELKHLKEPLLALEKKKKKDAPKKAARKKTATKPTAPQESDSESEEEMSEDPEESESGGPDSDGESSASASKTHSSAGTKKKTKKDTAEHPEPLEDVDILGVASDLAANWLKVARHLPDARSSGKKQLAFKFNDQRLSKIEEDTKDKTEEERLTQILHTWRGITPLHNRKCLYNALREMDFGTTADKHLK